MLCCQKGSPAASKLLFPESKQRQSDVAALYSGDQTAECHNCIIDICYNTLLPDYHYRELTNLSTKNGSEAQKSAHFFSFTQFSKIKIYGPLLYYLN